MLRVFHHYIRSSVIWLVLIELLMFYFAVLFAMAVRYPISFDTAMMLLQPQALAFAVVMMLSMTAMGLHSRNVVEDFSNMLMRIGLSFAVGFIGSTLVYYVYPALLLDRGVVFISFLASFIGIILVRTVYLKLDRHIFSNRILVIGTGHKASLISNIENEAIKRGQEIIAYVAMDEDEKTIVPGKIIWNKTTLLALVAELGIDEIVVAMDDRRKHFPSNQLLDCKMHGITIRDPLNFLERTRGHIEIDSLNPSLLIFSAGFSQAEKGKRIFDIAISTLILILASPLFIVTTILIWLSSFGRDPVFYRQKRMGLGDKPFSVLKFRSMKTDAEKNGAQFAKKKDSRVTLIGSFLRRTRIDELPQLINVLKGEMSFVGPRPERPEFVSKFEQSIAHYTLRHTVKPGITGWAQICYPYGDTMGDAKNKLQFDLYYIKNYSLFLDLTILVQTAQVVLFGQGAR